MPFLQYGMSASLFLVPSIQETLFTSLYDRRHSVCSLLDLSNWRCACKSASTIGQTIMFCLSSVTLFLIRENPIENFLLIPHRINLDIDHCHSKKEPGSVILASPLLSLAQAQKVTVNGWRPSYCLVQRAKRQIRDHYYRDCGPEINERETTSQNWTHLYPRNLKSIHQARLACKLGFHMPVLTNLERPRSTWMLRSMQYGPAFYSCAYHLGLDPLWFVGRIGYPIKPFYTIKQVHLRLNQVYMKGQKRSLGGAKAFNEFKNRSLKINALALIPPSDY